MTMFVSAKHWLGVMMITLLTLGFTQTVLADGQSGGFSHDHMMGGGWAMMFMGPLMMIVLFAAIVDVAVLAARWFLPATGTTASANSNARGILDERFARGEIDADEYRARCAELER